MKKILSVALLISVFVLSGCGVGVKKDLTSGQKTSYSGLTFDEAYTKFKGKKIIKDQEFSLGEDVDVYFSGVTGFKEENGKVFPGASMIYISNAGEKVIDDGDMFEGYSEKGMSTKDAETMKVNAKFGTPLKAGEGYVLKINIWDKKGTGKIESELNVKIKGIENGAVSNNKNNNPSNVLADNNLPMFGGPNVTKTPEMLKADEDFIALAIKATGSRDMALKSTIVLAKKYLEKGDLETAMLRFNQAWLLDKNNENIYKGFVEILNLQGKTEEANKILETYLVN